MKHIFKYTAFAAAILLFGAGQAQAHGPKQGACRNYTKTAYVNGKYSSGRAMACYTGRGAWELVNLSGPERLQGRLIDMVKSDVFNLGGISLTLRTADYRPAAYYNVPSRPYVDYRRVDYRHDERCNDNHDRDERYEHEYKDERRHYH